MAKIRINAHGPLATVEFKDLTYDEAMEDLTVRFRWKLLEKFSTKPIREEYDSQGLAFFIAFDNDHIFTWLWLTETDESSVTLLCSLSDIQIVKEIIVAVIDEVNSPYKLVYMD